MTLDGQSDFMERVIADEDDELALDMKDAEEVVEELIDNGVAHDQLGDENDEGTGRG